MGRFPFTKNFRKFQWKFPSREKRVPFKRVAKGLCVTRDKGSNLYVTRESYLKRNVIREYLNACDA